MFHKTANGAEVGDLIHTCELNDANPFDYLTELQETRGRTGQESGGMDALE